MVLPFLYEKTKEMKKTALILLMILLVHATSSFAYNGHLNAWYENLFYWAYYSNSDPDTNCAEVRPNPNGAYSGDIVIPSSIVVYDNVYPVKYVGEKSFQSCPDLTSVTIPNSVIQISNAAFRYSSNLTIVVVGDGVTLVGGWSFDGCTGLKDLYCYASKVPNALVNAFKDVNYETAILHVPSSSLNEYRTANEWKNFKHIVPIDDSDPKPTGVEAIKTPQHDTNDMLYTLDGRRTNHQFKGLFIHKGKKVVVK